jgi:diacylglycerol kinase (ATP)
MGLMKAFGNSMRGLSLALRSERAVRQETVVLAVAVPAAALLADTLWVAVALIGVVLLVLCVELLNTAIEKLCDHVTPSHHPEIGAIKDVASAAALCSQALAVLVWLAAVGTRLVSSP